MKEDLLFDALSEIKDSHIEEAANFEPKAKVLTPKKIIAAAACVALVAVSALTVSELTSHRQIAPTTTPTMGAPVAADTSYENRTEEDILASYPAVGTSADTNTDTEIAPEIGETEIGVYTVPGTTAGVACTVAPNWEERHITSKFGLAEVNGKRYTSSSMEAEYEDLEKVLGYVELTGHDYLSDKTYKTTVITYKLKDFSKELFIAVKFEDDDSFYVYECGTYKPDTVKDFLADTSFEKYVSKGEGYQVFHEVRDPVVSSVIMSDSTDEIITALVELLKKNPDVKAYEAPYEDTNDHISFGFRIKDYDCHAHFNENGRLSLSVGGFFYFDFTEEEYDEFIKIVEKNEKDKKTLSPVTTPTTEVSTAHPDGVVSSPAYDPSVTTTTAPPYIPSTSNEVSTMP